MFRHIREAIPAIEEQGVVLSCHCHNDLGLAVANSLAAVTNGARQVECTINGIGERAGNASLEEFVMALCTRGDRYRYKTSIETKRIYPVSRMVSKLTGLTVQRNKAIVGENAFAHEAGIHQDGMLKDSATYEIMDPKTVGIPESKLVLGKHSGRHAFRERIEALGYSLEEGVIEEVFSLFKALADKKKSVYDEDIEALIETQLDADSSTGGWQLIKLQVTSGNSAIPDGDRDPQWGLMRTKSLMPQSVMVQLTLSTPLCNVSLA